MMKYIEYTVKVFGNGSKEWRLNDKLHREDGPAIEWADGSKSWYINDKLHRERAPACECANGDKEYFLNGKRHREDGPALELADGDKFWFLNGKRVTEEEHRRLTSAVANHGIDSGFHGFIYKELTVQEISDLLGYEVKVVK